MLAKTQTDGVASLDSDRVFPLIDTILPFEVCLHHQVLPLALKNQEFLLGIVDPEDQSALDYVRKILAVMNCRMLTQPISLEEQRSVLSAYLCHTQQSQPQLKPPVNDSIAHSQSLLEPVLATDSISVKSLRSVPPLEIKGYHLDQPLECLENLAPADFVQELLVRVLHDGIGRLYFEAHAGQGRILWSQDGVLQSVVEAIEPDQFQGILNELKQLMEMPLTLIEETTKVEIERQYQDIHLLLRLRITHGTYGEEANLQVLRGAALKFYQQQQLSVLSSDALKLAEKLQKRLNQICDRMASTPLSSENLPELNQLLQTIVQQAQALLEQQGCRE